MTRAFQFAPIWRMRMRVLLGGVGELNKNRQPNFLVVDKNTEIQEIEDTLKSFIRREDISIILINQNVAEEVEIR